MVARAKQIVDVLGTCHVRDGWHFSFDRARAASFIASVAQFDEKDGECEHFHAVLSWMRDHGQSLDWIFDGDPLVMICRCAAEAVQS